MIVDAKHQEEDQPPQEAHKGRWLGYFALATIFVFALSAVILSPAANRADVLLRLLTIAASWPVVAGAVLITFLITFRTGISSYMKFAKVKYGELEVSAEQPQTPKEALGAVAIEAKLIGSGSPKPIDEDEPVTSVAPDIPILKRGSQPNSKDVNWKPPHGRMCFLINSWSTARRALWYGLIISRASLSVFTTQGWSGLFQIHKNDRVSFKHCLSLV